MDPEYLVWLEKNAPEMYRDFQERIGMATKSIVNFGNRAWLAARGQTEAVKDRGQAGAKMPVTVHPEEE